MLDTQELYQSITASQEAHGIDFIKEGVAKMDAFLAAILTAINDYSRAYAEIQFLKYDDNGNPQDVTPTLRRTLAKHGLVSPKVKRLAELVTQYFDSVPEKELVSECQIGVKATPIVLINSPNSGEAGGTGLLMRFMLWTPNPIEQGSTVSALIFFQEGFPSPASSIRNKVRLAFKSANDQDYTELAEVAIYGVSEGNGLGVLFVFSGSGIYLSPTGKAALVTNVSGVSTTQLSFTVGPYTMDLPMSIKVHYDETPIASLKGTDAVFTATVNGALGNRVLSAGSTSTKITYNDFDMQGLKAFFEGVNQKYEALINETDEGPSV